MTVGGAGQRNGSAGADVLARAAAAAEAAAIERARLLRAALEIVHRRAFVVRCAWCGRYEVGDLLVDAESLPLDLRLERLVAARSVTHGVCGPCFDRLADVGPPAP